MPDRSWTYSNLPVRPGGRGVRALGAVVPGVRRTQAEIAPYARAWEEHNARAVAATGPLWVVLGDSMAQGIGASAFDRGWPGALADLLAQRGTPAYRMVNLSAYGARTDDVVDRQWPAAERLGPADLVTCVVGSNDLWRSRRPALPAAFARLVEVLPPGAVVSNLPNPVREADEVDRLLRTRGVERGLRLADMRARRINWWGKLAPDFFHPNDAGYRAMAEVVVTALP